MTRTVDAFSFGDPVPVLDGAEVNEYGECGSNDGYYEPPFSLHGLARSLHANVHHRSALSVKRNILMSSFVEHRLLSRQDFSRFVLDYLVFGNAYLERINNHLGEVVRLKPSPAKYTRRSVVDDRYLLLTRSGEKHNFVSGSILHLLEPDINQETYGVPEYLAALNSVWLNESATLFRRKYYLNGTHAGFIFYMTDTGYEEEDIDNLKHALRESKGKGNFCNLFMHAPEGSKDGLQVIPIADASAKDEFFTIKNVSRDDVLAAHRVPPQIMGITSDFGSVEAVSNLFARNELIPLQERLKAVNAWAGEEVVRFEPYSINAGI